MRSGRIAFFVQVSLERDANKVLSSVESFMKRGGQETTVVICPSYPKPNLSNLVARPKGSAAMEQHQNASLPFFGSNQSTAASSPSPPLNVSSEPPMKANTHTELDDDEKACMDLLRSVPIFVHLCDEGLQTMVANSSVRHFKKGEPIIAEGSRPSGRAATP